MVQTGQKVSKRSVKGQPVRQGHSVETSEDNSIDLQLAGKKKVKRKKLAVPQGKSEVGYKSPPEEYKFQPGQSGNPKGSPKRRTNLWIWFCKYMSLNDTELAKLDSKKMTQAQQAALKLVQNMKKGKGSGSERLARHVFDREEGKAVEHLIIGNDDVLTDEECEEIRELLKNNVD